MPASMVSFFSSNRREVRYSSRKIALKTAQAGEKKYGNDSVTNIFLKLLLKKFALKSSFWSKL